MSFLPRRKTNTMKGLPPFPRNFFLASSGFTAPPPDSHIRKHVANELEGILQVNLRGAVGGQWNKDCNAWKPRTGYATNV